MSITRVLQTGKFAYRHHMSGRSTIEIMVLMLTGTVCLSLLAIGISITVVEAVNPEADTGPAFNALADVLSMILGALLGLLAGRTERGAGLHKRPDGEQDGL